MKNKVIFSNKLPNRNLFPAETVLLYDQILASKPDFKKWKSDFKFQISLQAGESLKTLDSLQKVLNQLDRKNIPQTGNLTFVAIGGGSVGDFVGFLASIFLRGRKFVQIPSTWLAAIDSAHGGKNALNLNKSKNQIGTIYEPDHVFVVRSLLESQPHDRILDSMGEIVKTAIIDSDKNFKFLEKNKNKINSTQLFKILPDLIQTKLKIVATDPFEKKGMRRVLNLGHTLGHVFESYYKLPHGYSVLLGTLFSARWSFELELLKETDYIRICELIQSFESSQFTLQECLKNISEKNIRKGLSKDKKMTAESEIDFIFIAAIGKVLRHKVSVQSIINEVNRQKMEF